MPMHLNGGYRSKNGMVTYGKQKKYKPGGENKAGLTKLVKMAKDKYGITAKRGKEYPGGGSYMGPQKRKANMGMSTDPMMDRRKRMEMTSGMVMQGGGSVSPDGLYGNTTNKQKQAKKKMNYGGSSYGKKPKKMGYGGSHKGMMNMDPAMEAARFRKKR